MDLNPRNIMRDTMRSLGFLTRLPIAPKWFEGDDGNLSLTCRAFPISGVIATLPAIATMLIAYALMLPPLLTGFLCVSVLTLTTGALHDDGIADVADGFFGGKDIARRLEIMKDSSVGTYGALALIMAFALRAVTIAAIVQTDILHAALAVMAAAAIARCALVWHWFELTSARPEGTAGKLGTPTSEAVSFALATAICVGSIAALMSRGLTPTILAFGFTAIATVFFKRLTLRKIGGHTGDTLGASAIIAESSFLIGLASGL